MLHEPDLATSDVSLTAKQKGRLKVAFLTAACVGLGKALGTGLGKIAVDAIRSALRLDPPDDPDDGDDDGDDEPGDGE